ncbi:MAG TPA: hypothetical protein PK605_13200 [Ignavibacteria bacterium]|nr:hypothetical protein [Ignavibacteria bacterium]HRF66328.1 hypothetical protein [Ignavibacteria bacterium]HRJ05352.1 hypothetical protein [Ignavibacteria bacterium]
MKKYLSFFLFFILLSVSLVSCTKKPGETSGESDKKSAGDTHHNQTKKINDVSSDERVFFGRYDGKKIIIDDYYKYSSNEKLMDSTGAGYDLYGGDLKAIIGKYGKSDEQTPEYFFDDFKPEFEKYTSFKTGDKIYISGSGGVFPAQISGYYINMDDMIGAGTIFYAAVNPPKEMKLEDNEIVVCTYNSNMSALNRKGVTNQSIIDEFKGYVMPKLKGVTVSEYNDKGEPKTKQLEKISNEDIKIFEGSFTGKDKNEFLVSVRLQNDFTNFTSLVYVMDGEGKVISEFVPLAVNNFTFSLAEGIIDINGDGVFEVITYDGYYEGGGYSLNKYNGGLWKTLTTGFVFGV